MPEPEFDLFQIATESIVPIEDGTRLAARDLMAELSWKACYSILESHDFPSDRERLKLAFIAGYGMGKRDAKK